MLIKMGKGRSRNIKYQGLFFFSLILLLENKKIGQMLNLLLGCLWLTSRDTFFMSDFLSLRVLNGSISICETQSYWVGLSQIAKIKRLRQFFIMNFQSVMGINWGTNRNSEELNRLKNNLKELLLFKGQFSR